MVTQPPQPDIQAQMDEHGIDYGEYWRCSAWAALDALDKRMEPGVTIEFPAVARKGVQEADLIFEVFDDGRPSVRFLKARQRTP